MTAPRGSTVGFDDGERRLAARHLLTAPILTSARHPEQLSLVRRHATALTAMFATQLGYALIVESTFARLVKAPLPAQAPSRPARRPTDDAPFPTATYVHLALVGAALLAPGVGEQILVSALVDQVRADAAEQELVVTDTLGDRRHLVAAIGLLVEWGVLAETDGSVTAWGERRQPEALLSIHRPLLAHLLPAALHDVTDPSQLWATPTSESPRRRLRRRLVESPAVLRADLPADEIDVLSRERNELARALGENFGLVLEVRAEGALAYDPAGGLTDLEFPGAGSVKQAALLLLDRIVTEVSPTPANTVEVEGTVIPAALCPWADVDRLLADLLAQHRRSWKAAYGESPEQLRTHVVELLVALGLARSLPTGLAVHPPAARYRPAVQPRANAPTLFDVDPSDHPEPETP